MSIESDKIWFDGEFVDFEDARVHVLTHTLHYGFGAFEGIRCYKQKDGNSAVFRLTEHLERLHETCEIATIDLSWSVEDLEQACRRTVELNGFESCYIRPLVFLGHGEMGLGARGNEVHTAIMSWDWGALMGDEGLSDGIHAKVASFSRHSVNSAMVKGKIIGQYANSILGNREVVDAGYDEAIFLDTEGYVSEGAGMNLFMVRDNELVTTPVGGSILEGITRSSVIELARARGYSVREERFTRDMLYTADEVFMTGTAAEVTPISRIDERDVGTGKPGPITKELQEAFFEAATGQLGEYDKWLTPVEV